MSYQPRHAATTKPAKPAKTEHDHEELRKLSVHVAFMVLGLVISVAGVWLHWDVLPALTVPVTAPVAQEFVDAIVKL